MIKSIQPLNDRVLIKPINEEEQRRGSILIADMGEDKTRYGEVIAVGPGRMSEFGHWIPVDNVTIGDKVVIPRIGTQRIEIEGEEYWALPAKEIVAKLELAEE